MSQTMVEEESESATESSEHAEEFILDSTLRCTLCDFNLNIASGAFKVCSHPLLHVPVCIVCIENYTKEYDPSMISEVCTWCLQGGFLFQCGDEECNRCICEDCIVKWVPEVLEEINESEDDDWRCFVCQPSPTLDKLISARQKGHEASLYKGLYFDSDRFRDLIKTKADNSDETPYQITEDESNQARELLDMVITERHNAEAVLLDDQKLLQVRTEIESELGEHHPKVEEEVEAFLEHWNMHKEIMQKQQDELMESMDLVGIDCSAVAAYADERWNRRQIQRNPELQKLEEENERMAAVSSLPTNSNTGITGCTVSNGSSSVVVGTSSSKSLSDEKLDNFDPTDLFTDWDGYEDEEAKRGAVYSPYPSETVAADSFVQMYSTMPEVPHNRYPKVFEETVPREVLRGIYYRRLRRASDPDEYSAFKKALKRFKVPLHIEKVVYYASRFVSSASICTLPFAYDVHPAITKTFLVKDLDFSDISLLCEGFGLDPEYGTVEDLGDGNFDELLDRVQREGRKLRIETDRGDFVDALDRETEEIAANNAKRKQRGIRVREFQITRTVLDDSDKLDVIKKMKKSYRKYREGELFVKGDKSSRRSRKQPNPSRRQQVTTSLFDLDIIDDMEGQNAADQDANGEQQRSNSNDESDTRDSASTDSGEHEVSRLPTKQRKKRRIHTTLVNSPQNGKTQADSPSPKKSKLTSPVADITIFSPPSASSASTSSSAVEFVNSVPASAAKSNMDVIDLTNDDDDDDDDDGNTPAPASTIRRASTGTLDNFLTGRQVTPYARLSATRPTPQSSVKKTQRPPQSALIRLPLTNTYTFEMPADSEASLKKEFDSETSSAFIINPTEDKRNKDPLVTIPISMLGKLKEHQKEAQRFLWRNLIKSFSTLKTPTITVDMNVGGCLISHCMGLGKTLTVITFSITLLACPAISSLRHPPRKPTAKSSATDTESSQQSLPASQDPVSPDTNGIASTSASTSSSNLGRKCVQCILVLAPVNTLENWKNEYRKWTPDSLKPLIKDKVYNIASSDKVNDRYYKVHKWYTSGGVLIMGHEMFRGLLNSKPSAVVTDTNIAQMKQFLLEGPDVVVIDEAHIMKAKASEMCMAVSRIKTKRRIALTGSPLQNNLLEYYVMVNWIRKGYLTSSEAYFRKWFMNPIAEGEHKDATEQEKLYMKKRSYVLHKKLLPIVDRKDITTLERDLPPKREFVISVRMTDFQKYLYKHFLKVLLANKENASMLFSAYQNLLRLWNHPGVTVLKSLLEDAQEKDKDRKDTAKLHKGPKHKRTPKSSSEVNKFHGQARMMERLRTELYRPKRVFDGLAEEARVVDLSELEDLTASDKMAAQREEEEEEEVMDELEEDDANFKYIYETLDEIQHQGSDSVDQFHPIVPDPDPELQRSENPVPDAEGSEILIDDDKAETAAEMESDMDADVDIEDDEISVENGDAQSDFQAECVQGISEDEMVVFTKNERSPSIASEATVHPAYWSQDVVDVDDIDTDADADIEVADISILKAEVSAEVDVHASVTPSVNPSPMLVDESVATRKTRAESDADVEELAADEPVADDSIDEDPEGDDISPEVKHYWRLTHLPDPPGLASAMLSEAEFLRLGNKVFLLLALIKATVDAGDKLLVFSSSIPTLDLIEYCLKMDNWGAMLPESPTSSGFVFSKWIPGRQYFRIDGTVESDKRQQRIDDFNKNDKHKIFLLSTKAANMGINLQSANRVVIFDSSWNPAVDLQAIFRCYRYGQTKPVFVYRLLAAGSMEEKVYKKQVEKQALAARVVDAKTPESQYNKHEKAELMLFQDDSGAAVDADAIDKFEEILSTGAKDEVLRHLLRPLTSVISSIADQGSLLKDNELARLSVEEQREAETEFEGLIKPTVAKFPLNPQPTTASTDANQSNAGTKPVVTSTGTMDARPLLNMPAHSLGFLSKPLAYMSESSLPMRLKYPFAYRNWTAPPVPMEQSVVPPTMHAPITMYPPQPDLYGAYGMPIAPMPSSTPILTTNLVPGQMPEPIESRLLPIGSSDLSQSVPHPVEFSANGIMQQPGSDDNK